MIKKQDHKFRTLPEKCPVSIRISENWNADRNARGIILLIKDSNLDVTDEIELGGMKVQYEQAIKDANVIVAPLKHCINIAENIRESQLAVNNEGETFVAPPIFIAASEKVKPQSTKQSAMGAYNKSKPLEEPPDGVIIEGHSKKALTEIENAVFKGTYRARARWGAPESELELEALERFVGDGWEWKDAVMEVYPDTKPENLDSEVNRLQHVLARDRKSPKKNKI